jgi:hypothetical protein
MIAVSMASILLHALSACRHASVHAPKQQQKASTVIAPLPPPSAHLSLLTFPLSLPPQRLPPVGQLLPACGQAHHRWPQDVQVAQELHHHQVGGLRGWG